MHVKYTNVRNIILPVFIHVQIKYEETLCAAKQMHELLLQAGNEGVQDIIGKYRQECQLMAGLRHPNITYQ